MGVKIERSLVLIKPDGVQRGLIGRILERFEQAGLKIVALKLIWVGKDFAKKHYKAHVQKSFFDNLVGFLIEGPVVAMVLEGPHAVEVVRKLVGPTSPHEAPAGTIRGDFAIISMEYANSVGMGGRNLIHASGNEKEAEYEIKLWFKKEEILDYPRVDQKHTMGK